MKTPIVSTHNLTKSFGSGDNLTQVLRGLNINIYAGEFLIIFGPSGSGKSTLLNILSGLETPTSGRVIVDSQDLSLLTKQERSNYHRDKIGMVFQSYNLISSLTVLQNITLPLVFAKIPKLERLTRARELLTEFGLEKLTHRLPSEISGGQAQRVGIIRALINRPPIIIADEPTGNLDSVTTKTVMNLFSDLNHRYQNTLIVVTHDSSLFTYADRIIFILDGQVVKEKAHHPVASKSIPISIPYDAILKKESNPQNLKMLELLSIILSRHQLSAFDSSELDRTVTFLNQFIAKKIDSPKLLTSLDKSQKTGGAGLYRPTAEFIVDSLSHLIKVIS